MGISLIYPFKIFYITLYILYKQLLYYIIKNVCFRMFAYTYKYLLAPRVPPT